MLVQTLRGPAAVVLVGLRLSATDLVENSVVSVLGKRCRSLPYTLRESSPLVGEDIPS